VNSWTLSITYIGCHSIFSDNYKVCSDCVCADDLWISSDITFLTIHDAAMALFLLSIWRVDSEFIDAVHSIRQLSVNIHWWFQGLQGCCICWRFMDQQWHSVFDNSLCQPWLYFCYQINASVVNSLTLSIPYSNYHSVFIDDLKV